MPALHHQHYGDIMMQENLVMSCSNEAGHEDLRLSLLALPTCGSPNDHMDKASQCDVTTHPPLLSTCSWVMGKMNFKMVVQGSCVMTVSCFVRLLDCQSVKSMFGSMLSVSVPLNEPCKTF